MKKAITPLTALPLTGMGAVDKAWDAVPKNNPLQRNEENPFHALFLIVAVQHSRATDRSRRMREKNFKLSRVFAHILHSRFCQGAILISRVDFDQ
jgi:hypothetical protein